MIRRYCDMCGLEMGARNTPNLGGTGNRMAATLTRLNCALGVEVITSKNGVSNSGDFCKYCILDALQDLEGDAP